MSEPIRVLHVFGALNPGGVENFVMNMYRRMDTSEVQFDFAMTSGKTGLYDEEVLAHGGHIYYFDGNRSLIENLNAVFEKSDPFAAVHSHVFFYSGLVLRSAKKHGVPIRIAHAHNAHTGESRSVTRLAYETLMRELINKNATCMLGCSEKACRHVFGDRAVESRRAEVLPDGIDCNRFAFDPGVREKMRKKYGLDGKFVVGHVGHFLPAKNHEKIVSVFKRISEKRDAALMLTGDGPLEEDVRSMAERLGISDKLIITGAMPDVEKAYQAMDVFLFPSRYEGFGMAMIEAQAGGLACVASDVVPEDTNADGRAVYLPLDAPDEDWAKAVINAPERSPEPARLEFLRNNYDDAAVAKKLCKIYCRK